jgi:hypothetical protein
MTEVAENTKTKVRAATVIESVTMIDGRVVEFAGKRKLLKESFVTDDGKVQVRLDFRNGETRLFTLPGELMNKFAAHGAEQKLGDEIAGLDEVEDCILAIDELIDRLYKLEWSVKRESGGMAGASVLVRALAQLYGKPTEAIKAFLSNKTQAEKVALRNNPKVKPIVEAIEAERNAKKANVDTDALLNELA